VSGDTEPAGEFEQLIRAVCLTFHQRDAPRSQLANASLAVLEHLTLAGQTTLRRQREVLSEELLASDCGHPHDSQGMLATQPLAPVRLFYVHEPQVRKVSQVESR
jgi:hypothetical protein